MPKQTKTYENPLAAAQMSIWFTWTVSFGGGDTPDAWWIATKEFFRKDPNVVKAVASLERGDQKGNLHMQMVVQMRLDAALKSAFVTFYKRVVLGLVSGTLTSCQICLKPLAKTQSYKLMYGYVSKDRNKGHFETYVKNVTIDEIEDGIKEHQLTKLDPAKGRTALNKSNLFKEMYRYSKTYLEPLQLCAALVLRCMLQSNYYMPTGHWLTGQGGSGIKPARAERYWRMLHDPQSATLDDVDAIFFYTPYTSHRADLNADEAAVKEPWRARATTTKYEDWTLAQILREAEQQRDALRELEEEANINAEPPLIAPVAADGQSPLGSTQPWTIDVEPAPLDLDSTPGPHHHKRNRLPLSDEDDDDDVDENDEEPRPMKRLRRNVSQFIIDEAEDDGDDY